MHAQVTKTWLVVLDGENNPMDALQQGSSNNPVKERLVARGRSGKEWKKKANTSATDGEIICVLIRVVNLSLPIVSHQIAT